MSGFPQHAGNKRPAPQDIEAHEAPMPGEYPVEPPVGHPEWHTLEGRLVEVQRNGRAYRQAWVDAAMPDGSGLWLAALGNAGRELIWQDDGFTVHALEARALSPCSPRNRGIQ
ncbi:hypothetical protein J2809_004163 [Arthrobacter pascens]|uniref:hypothetical protein n=1 Tax=Arthrobacter pascens TaxID=1677 RepID=UPI0028631E56|nr:hypothetical protein [Arthrobacter pascens]MDR6559780.1 hypothetical protein [Arthrobacter pascens]